MRPRNLSVASLNDCAPKLTRFTPAERKSDSFDADTVPGFASSVISAPGWIPKSRSASSIRVAIDCESKSDGVPPPKKIVFTSEPHQGASSARWRISAATACTYSFSGQLEAAYELKSQY